MNERNAPPLEIAGANLVDSDSLRGIGNMGGIVKRLCTELFRGSLAVLAAASVFELGIFATEAGATYSFEFTTGDYAIEVPAWEVATFPTVIENTGTSADSISLDITKTLPPGWSADFCIGPKCFFNHTDIYLTPGQTVTIDVEIFVDSDNEMGTASLTGTMHSNPAETHTERYAAWCEIPSIMIVDDDGGAANEVYLRNALQNAGYPGHVWDVSVLDRPTLTRVLSYWNIFWTTAGAPGASITPTDESNLMAFLNGGGNLFIASMNYLSGLGGANAFTDDYLHITSWSSNTGGSPMIGVAGDPISSSMSLALTGGPFPADSSDSFTLDAAADTIFSSAAGATGLKVAESGHRLVFLAYPFEDVSTSDPDPNNQDTLISRVMAWFEPPVAGVDMGGGPASTQVARIEVAPNPLEDATTVSFALPAGGPLEIAVYDVAGRLVRSLAREASHGGTGVVVWDARDAQGRPVGPGVYLCRIATQTQSAEQKVVVLK